MPQVYGDNVKGLKELYAFRLMLKLKVVAYKNAIGHEPDHAQLKQILYVCMDMTSKNLEPQSGLDRKLYFDMCEDIDRRYRLQFEGLDFAKAAKGDDHRGLSIFFENHEKPPAPVLPEEPERNTAQKEDLDVVGNGKGRGKNDGKCNICGGNGHFARDCPSTMPLTDAICRGCEGKGHFERVCPTANSHLKGSGARKGWSQKGGGYKGGWQGGKGGKGKGKGS